MTNTTFLVVYLATAAGCILLTFIIIKLLTKGIKTFLTSLNQDAETSTFFTKLIILILLLGGLSASLSNGYDTDEKANWLTLSWDSVDQVQATLSSLFTILIVFAVTFLILELFNRKFLK